MAREGKVIVKILKDVCSPIPYMGHSHERSLVHLLNPCDDVNRKDIQCNTFSFDYYEEGDNLVFKVKDNATVVGYNVSKEFTVVYWSAEDNNFVHTQGDGNGGNFNRSGFFVQEGDYYVGKVNKDWFLKFFEDKSLVIKVTYFDLDNHEEELLHCYSIEEKSNNYTKKNKSLKCNPSLNITRQDLAAGFSYHLVFGINDTNTNFKAGEDVKYYIKYFIDDVEQPEELVYTHNTGGLVPNKEKDIYVPGHVKKVHFVFRIEYPKNYTIFGNIDEQKGCYIERTELTPNNKPNPKPNKPTIKCSPLMSIVNKQHQPTGWSFDLLLQSRATVPANTVTKLYLSYALDGKWNSEELVHTDIKGGNIEDFEKSIFIPDENNNNVTFKLRVEYPPEIDAVGSENNSCASIVSAELKQVKPKPDYECKDSFLNIDTVNNKALFFSGFKLNKGGIYNYESKLYWSDDNVSWTEDPNPFRDLGDYKSEFDLTLPTHKYYKGIFSIKKENVLVHTCESVAEYGKNSKNILNCSATLSVTERKNLSGSNIDIVADPNGLESLLGEEVIYVLEKKTKRIDGSTNTENLIYYNRTDGGRLPHINKSDYTLGDVESIEYTFRLEFPNNYIFTETNTNICSTNYFIKLKEKADCNITIDFNENSKEATLSGTVTKYIQGNYKITPKLFSSQDSNFWSEINIPYEDLGNNTFKFKNIPEPLQSYYKGEFIITDLDDNGNIIKTCDTENFVVSNGQINDAFCRNLSIERVPGKGAVVDMQNSTVVFGNNIYETLTLKFYYRLKNELHYKQFKEFQFRQDTKQNNYEAEYTGSHSEGYYIKAELYKGGGIKLCSSEELLIE